MFTSVASHLLCAWFAFALPAYATYKARASPDALRALSQYWALVGLFVAFEHSLGLFLSWLPFYWELRTVFLLYIALPQTQGSAYVYETFLEPWLSRNEAELDRAVASAQANAIAFCRTRVTALVGLVWRSLNGTSVADSEGDTQKPPPAVPIDHLKGLRNTYTPALLAAFVPNVSGPAQQQAHPPYSAN